MSNSAYPDILSITGIIITCGDNINTDLIMPSQYLDNPNPSYFSQFVMSGQDPEFVNKIQKIHGQFELPAILVAGTNFGSGSSREQAPAGLKYIGIAAIVAESFGSIFFRNAINVGLPVITVPNITKMVKNGISVKINLRKGFLDILEQNSKKIHFKPLEPFLLRRLESGGLIPELKQQLKSSNKY